MARIADVAILISALLLLGSCDRRPSTPTEQVAVAPARPAIALAGRVTDAAHILTPAQASGLSIKLENLERATGHQMVIVTAPTLAGQDVATFTRKLGNDWGIGRKGVNDGVVLLVAPNERKVRISVGYGLEKTLPRAACQEIIDQLLLPRFREGDVAGGIDAGVDALIRRLR